MNRELIVTLLRKDIQELDMITQGFMEMSVYPKTILLLAQRKTEDIQRYIMQLAEIDLTPTVNVEKIAEVKTIEAIEPEIIPELMQVEEEKVQENEVELDITENTDNSYNEELPIEIIEFESVTIASEVAEPFEEAKPIEVAEISIATVVEDNTSEEVKPIPTTSTRNELLSKADNTLGNALGNKKIDDLKQAISIGDRFRFQRELFKGNGEEMNKSITYINQLATLEEALSFLTSKYGWSEDNDAVEDFLQIVRRRFL